MEPHNSSSILSQTGPSALSSKLQPPIFTRTSAEPSTTTTAALWISSHISPRWYLPSDVWPPKSQPKQGGGGAADFGWSAEPFNGSCTSHASQRPEPMKCHNHSSPLNIIAHFTQEIPAVRCLASQVTAEARGGRRRRGRRGFLGSPRVAVAQGADRSFLSQNRRRGRHHSARRYQ